MEALEKARATDPGTTEEFGTEAQLLEGLRTRDRAACGALIRQYMPRLYRLALQVTGNAEDAEDALQEAFIHACSAATSFESRAGSSLGSWLYRIVLNAALTVLRRRKPGVVPLVEEPGSGSTVPAAALIDRSPRPDDRLLSRELRDTIDRAILALPDSLRAAFVLRDIEGIGTAEAAATLGISETAVKVRLHRARLALRDALRPYLQGQAAETGEKG